MQQVELLTHRDIRAKVSSPNRPFAMTIREWALAAHLQRKKMELFKKREQKYNNNLLYLARDTEHRIDTTLHRTTLHRTTLPD